MIFPRKKVAPAPAPWWQANTASKNSKGSIALIAVLAGAAGGILGVNASGASLFNRVNLVSSTSTIERAPDSVAGTAQRVLPSVVSIQPRSLTGAGTGSGFFIDSDGYILTNNHVLLQLVLLWDFLAQLRQESSALRIVQLQLGIPAMKVLLLTPYKLMPQSILATLVDH